MPLHPRSPTSIRPLPLVLALVLGSPAVLAAETHFTPGAILDWEPHSFTGETRYEPVEVDDREAIHAVCNEGTASGLFYRDDIDLRETPVIEWDWRVDDTFSGIDETVKAGDDYAARVYVVDESRILRWRTRALNYVWASEQATGEDWPNAYASQARMIALRSGADAGSGWQTERRNILEDFRRYHDREPERINALAIMTDCDDTGDSVEAWYGNIRFLPE
jgi:hypothetical protein